MKALISVAAGGPETLQLAELPTPEPGEGQVRVRVLACGVNYPDSLVIQDLYQVKLQRPFAPGSEIAGVVEKLGPGVADWKLGDRLIAVIGHGGLAEQAVVPASEAYALPAEFDARDGAALLMTYATTIHALADRGQLRAGETLLVLGAAGGVGLAAIEIGKALGATVVAAVSDEAKAKAASAAGADRTLIYGRAPFDREAARVLGQQFKDAVGPGGADVVYDPVGGDYSEPSLRSMAWAGRYLVIGFAAGVPKAPLNLTLLKSCDIRGVFWGAWAARNPQANRANVLQLLDWWRAGKIAPKVGGVWPLAKGGEAIAWLAGRQAIGKAVVEVSA